MQAYSDSLSYSSKLQTEAIETHSPDIHPTESQYITHHDADSPNILPIDTLKCDDALSLRIKWQTHFLLDKAKYNAFKEFVLLYQEAADLAVLRSDLDVRFEIENSHFFLLGPDLVLNFFKNKGFNHVTLNAKHKSHDVHVRIEPFFQKT